jgi:predicted nucleic acid-binding protein
VISIDASVWISLFLTTDRFHPDSIAWFRSWQFAGNATVVPGHFPAEVAGAISRLSSDQSQGLQALDTLVRDPLIVLVAVDEPLAYQSARLASTLRLKGSDAIYVALAQHLSVPLVSWDNEQIQRGGHLVSVMTPTQALQRMP